jgi:hypothetical protein
MSWKLFLDDLRYPTVGSDWIIARSTDEAKKLVELWGPPAFISFDHDLGGDDTSMVFLRWLSNEYYDAEIDYCIHSANPIGSANLVSVMESWKKSKSL